jgi:hypothetical protein
MRIAIIDGVNQDIGLKILFPDADYFINNTELDKSASLYKFNISTNTNWTLINDKNYDVLFVVVALYDAYPNTEFYKQPIRNIVERFMNIIHTNNFKYVAIFDNYDYDYDPTIIISHPKINIFFKRNYNKSKQYNSIVVPFPFIMFGEKSLIEKCNDEMVSKEEYFKPKINRIFFSGSLFIHTDHLQKVYIDRIKIYNEIKHTIYNPGIINYNSFINELRNSKFSLDLLGVGDPNKRTFEILLSGSLMISQYNELLWPFEEDFLPETKFKDKFEYLKIIYRLSNDHELYQKCLQRQFEIVNKYFNLEWIKNYILNYVKIS